MSHDGLGANPVEALLHLAGRWALVFLLITLAVTPVRRMTGWNRIVKLRRPLGLFAFFYLCLHLSTYVGLDQLFAMEYIVEDVVERPYITVGFAAFLLLVPLAITSTRGWIRRLGRRWQRLHRLVYPATALGVLHFYWQVKADTLWPLVAAAALVVLLLARSLPFDRKLRSGKVHLDTVSAP
ncbi:sulfite oxidase heme-binding subunit YedZ [Gemmatimonadota bacterium]